MARQYHFDTDVGLSDPRTQLSETIYRPVGCMPVTLGPRKAPRHRPATLIVVGVPRGGTSVVSALVDALGVPMGDHADLAWSGVYEQPGFNTATEDEWQPAIACMNARYELWGFKNPRIGDLCWRLPRTIRNPCLLCVTRDPVAIAQRWLSVHHRPDGLPFTGGFREALQLAQEQLAVVCKVISDHYGPRLITSYERLLTDPLPYIAGLCRWLGLAPSVAQMMAAVRRVDPRGGYIVPQQYAEAWQKRHQPTEEQTCHHS